MDGPGGVPVTLPTDSTFHSTDRLKITTKSEGSFYASFPSAAFKSFPHLNF